MFHSPRKSDANIDEQIMRAQEGDGEPESGKDVGKHKMTVAPLKAQLPPSSAKAPLQLSARGEIDVNAGADAMNAGAGLRVKLNLPWSAVWHLWPWVLEQIRILRKRE